MTKLTDADDCCAPKVSALVDSITDGFAVWVSVKLFVARLAVVTTNSAVRVSIPAFAPTVTFISVSTFLTPPVGKSVHQSADVAMLQSESAFTLITTVCASAPISMSAGLMVIVAGLSDGFDGFGSSFELLPQLKNDAVSNSDVRK